ncbi:unnamed protein product [Brachionus calyciflorus]|uniref:Calpain catalytic domain-containing protein n=1 Tax=Brachionus calyciflorus TaxID=104777 RepID=A0A813X5J5_9BILA|nr:unnamed protein product [Brachionus calyciflorus]
MPQINSYLDQEYELLKSEAKSSGQLFVDDKFPANDSSIFKFKNFLESQVYWKRPRDIVENPKFIVNKIEPNDLNQGRIGNSWMVAAASCVLCIPELIEKIIPINQSFDESEYTGIFHFKFWVNGEWVDVIIDDFLPVDENNQLLFCKNLVEKNEMYGSLFEKAYAKLNLCYEFLIAGYPHDALIDLTGGVNEVYDLKFCRLTPSANEFIDPNRLWEILYYMIGLPYSILNVFELIEDNALFDQIREYGSKKPLANSIRLLRLRIPFGKNINYNGPWSKGSEEWQKVSEITRKNINVEFEEDGQFLISFEDFVQNFDFLSICHVNLNAFSNDGVYTNRFWQLKMFKGEWVVGKSAGGSSNEISFWTNPQHKFSIKDSNKSLLVSLSQEGISKKRFQTQGNFSGIHEALGFYIYDIKANAQMDNEGKYDKKELILFNYTRVFKYQKEVCIRLQVTIGDYIIIPCYLRKEQPGTYVLRIFIQSDNNLEQVKNENYPNDDVKSVIDNLDLYEELYYQRMKRLQDDETNDQTRENISQACLIM